MREIYIKTIKIMRLVSRIKQDTCYGQGFCLDKCCGLRKECHWFRNPMQIVCYQWKEDRWCVARWLTPGGFPDMNCFKVSSSTVYKVRNLLDEIYILSK